MNQTSWIARKTHPRVVVMRTGVVFGSCVRPGTCTQTQDETHTTLETNEKLQVIVSFRQPSRARITQELTTVGPEDNRQQLNFSGLRLA